MDFPFFIVHTKSVIAFPCDGVSLEVVFEFEWRAKHILATLGMLKSTNIGCSLFKPPHYTSKDAPKFYQTWKVLFAKQPTPDQNSH